MKRFLLSFFALAVTAIGSYADGVFTITSSDPAEGECSGIARDSYWKFSSNMDNDASFVAISYEFYDKTTEGSLYTTTCTKSDKYVAADGMWEIKNKSYALDDFKQGHTIYLIIEALDNTVPSLANVLGKDTVVYTGSGSAEYEYSPATIVSISPVAGTELKSSSDNTFVLTFSQAVSLDMDKTQVITGQMATAAFTSVTCSEDGTVWTLVAPESVIASATPALQFNVYGTDMDGKTLEGNTSGAYRMEENSYYKFKYDCLLGSPSLTVTPAAGVVTSLKDFKVAYSGGMDLSYAAGVADITVENEAGEIVSTVSTKTSDAQITIDEDNTYATFSLPEEITSTGKYTLTIPSKLFALGTEFDGYTSKEQKVVYTLEAGSLTADITPANDTEWETMPNISVSFSDPSAVGYANYVITDLNPDDPENPVLMSGDLMKQGDGTWATKYLSMYDIKLYAGHSYEVKVNAYASEMDYNYGNAPMATFASCIKGTSIAFEYSDVTYVSTDPEDYSTISSCDFTVEFSGSVESLSAEVIGSYSTIACTTAPANNSGKTWKVTMPESVIKSSTGSININLVAKDAYGLYVQGNTADPDTTYLLTYNCYEGAPEYTISPATGSTVEKIDVIICSYAGKINPGWSFDEATIKKGDETVCTMTSNNVTVDEESINATVTLPEPITEAGTYTITFPATFFALGEEFEGCSSKEQTVVYTVCDPAGIKEIENGKLKMENYYNLAGQKVTTDTRGIVITDGKKILK